MMIFFTEFLATLRTTDNRNKKSHELTVGEYNKLYGSVSLARALSISLSLCLIRQLYWLLLYIYIYVGIFILFTFLLKNSCVPQRVFSHSLFTKTSQFIISHLPLLTVTLKPSKNKKCTHTHTPKKSTNNPQKKLWVVYIIYDVSLSGCFCSVYLSSFFYCFCKSTAFTFCLSFAQRIRIYILK